MIHCACQSVGIQTPIVHVAFALQAEAMLLPSHARTFQNTCCDVGSAAPPYRI